VGDHPEIYLVGTVMLIFAMGLFGLFISNGSQGGSGDRALKNTTLFGMFSLTVSIKAIILTNYSDGRDHTRLEI